MRTFRQPACILHVRAWRETSLLLECLTADHGRVGLVARGARGARARVARATLEPFQLLELEYRGSGELAMLVAAEPVDAPQRLAGVALLAGLYLNELLVRLLPRSDPQDGLLSRYREAVSALAEGGDTAWTLRRFERDLLAIAGYGFPFALDASSGEQVDHDVEYTCPDGQGMMPWRGQAGIHLPGSALLDFVADRYPGEAAMPALRKLLRAQIEAQLGDRGLQSWRVLDDALRAAARR